MRTLERSTNNAPGQLGAFFLLRAESGVSGMLTCINGKNGMASRFP